jgi:hypothetical protein
MLFMGGGGINKESKNKEENADGSWKGTPKGGGGRGNKKLNFVIKK